MIRNDVPSAGLFFVIILVVGPSDLGLCLTGALHNKWISSGTLTLQIEGPFL